MDFSIDERTEAFRAEVRAFLAEHLTDAVVGRVRETGTVHDWGFHRALAQRGWIGAAWPTEEGGQGRDAYDMDVLYEELARAGAPTDGFSTTMIVAETIRRVGTAEQRERILPAVQAGKLVISLGYSEPDVGSDLASVATTAVRDGERWVINGQKAFTTLAHEAGYVFLLARTNPEAPAHRGLTTFLVPTSSEGFDLTPVHTLGGERTNMTFYSDVAVDDAARVGEVDGGWRVIMLALAFERGGEFAAQLARLVDAAAGWARAAGEKHPRVLRRIGRAAADAEVARLLGSRATWLRATERAGDIEGSMAKLYATEALRRASSALLSAAGARAVLRPGAPDAPAGGSLEHAFRHAHVTTIYGGTSEILRGLIAERRLGLPRSRPAAPSRRERVAGEVAATAPGNGAPRADGPRTWTHVYVQFSLPEADRRTLDESLRAAGTSLGQQFQRALARCLADAGIDPSALSRPPR